MLSLQTLIEHAAECRQKAAATNLPNVRERYLKSALAFDEMAERLRTFETRRAKDRERKASE
jgi:hypothetical protein